MMRIQKFSVAALLVLLVGTTAWASRPKEFQKTITEEFSLTPDGQVDIENRYGNVDIETWTDERVKIEVTITVDTRNESIAEEVFDRININFSNTTSLVRAETDIESGKGWNRIWQSNNKEYNIYYHVWMPQGASVDVVNKYGSVYVAETQGEIRAEVKYGNVRLDGTDKDVLVDLGYGKGTVGRAGDLDLTMKYSKLDCGELGDVRAETKYSSFTAEKALTIRANTSYDNFKVKEAESFSNYGKYDDFEFEKISSVISESKYTDMRIGTLTDNASFDYRYGGINIDEVASGFSDIDIETEYTGVRITVDPSASYVVDAYTNYCPIRHSGLEVRTDIQKSNEHTLKGFKGSENASSKIYARMRYGGLRIY